MSDSAFKKGLPYSSHHKRIAGKSENVIYIPSNEEEFDAEISRSDYFEMAKDQFNNSCFDNCFTQQNLTYGDLLENFSFGAARIRQPGLASKEVPCHPRVKHLNFEVKTSADTEHLKEFYSGMEGKDENGSVIAQKLDSFFCDKPISELLGSESSDLLLNIGRCDTVVNKPEDAGSDKGSTESVIKTNDNSNQKSHQQNCQQNNFVEINLLAIDAVSQGKEESTEDLSQLKKRNLRGIVRALIKKVFESPGKKSQCLPLKRNYAHKQKEIKISVDELFKDDKLDFIVKDSKKVDKCTEYLTSKKAMFLQLCFLATLSIYFMSYFNTMHPIKF